MTDDEVRRKFADMVVETMMQDRFHARKQQRYSDFVWNNAYANCDPAKASVALDTGEFDLEEWMVG